MLSLSNKSRNKRPKFLLNFSIAQLTNIPQSKGYCYCKWHLKDGTGVSNYTVEKEGQVIDTYHQSKGTTPRVFVRNHRAKWNYAVDPPIKLKLRIGKNKDLDEKLLVVDVYFEFLHEDHSKEESSSHGIAHEGNNRHIHSYTQKVTGKILLGTVTIDITQYIDQKNTEFHNRFLLQQSKVNSILSMSIKMQLIRGAYGDFLSRSNTLLPQQIVAGIGNADATSETSSNIGSPISHTSIGADSSSLRHLGSSGHGSSKTGPGSNNKNKHTSGDALVSLTIANPLVEKLYQKTFQFPWDPRTGELTPKECVEDIIEGGDGWAKNEKGINLIDLDTLEISDVDSSDYLLAALLNQQGINYYPSHFSRNLNNASVLPTNNESQTMIPLGNYLKNRASNYYEEPLRNTLDPYVAENIKNYKSWKVTKILD